MIDREYRLRLRIDVLTDRVEALERERDKLLARCEDLRRRNKRWSLTVKRLRLSVALWKGRAYSHEKKSYVR